MRQSSSQLDAIVPHRPPMRFIDEVVSYDAASRTLVAAVTAQKAWRENWVAVEWMAQAAAALAGMCDRDAGYAGEPRPGFLLGTRRLELACDGFEPGRRYEVRAANAYSDDTSASFDCEVRSGGEVMAKAVLNAYRPEDMKSFMEEQK